MAPNLIIKSSGCQKERLLSIFSRFCFLFCLRNRDHIKNLESEFPNWLLDPVTKIIKVGKYQKPPLSTYRFFPFPLLVFVLGEKMITLTSSDKRDKVMTNMYLIRTLSKHVRMPNLLGFLIGPKLIVKS